MKHLPTFFCTALLALFTIGFAAEDPGISITGKRKTARSATQTGSFYQFDIANKTAQAAATAQWQSYQRDETTGLLKMLTFGKKQIQLEPGKSVKVNTVPFYQANAKAAAVEIKKEAGYAMRITNAKDEVLAVYYSSKRVENAVKGEQKIAPPEDELNPSNP